MKYFVYDGTYKNVSGEDEPKHVANAKIG
jgi:hypothetical protein